MTLLEHLKSSADRFAAEITAASKDVESAVMQTVNAGLSEVRADASAFVQSLATYAAAHPEPIFAILRRLQPILVVNHFALVTRAQDVQEVLSRDDLYEVPYAEKMGLITDRENFFLGMSDGPRYERDRTNALMTLRRDDLGTKILPFVARASHSIVAECGGQLDFVGQLSQVVPARLVGDYFGTPGPSEREIFDWASALFWFLFLDQTNDPSVRQRALGASAKLNAYLDQTIAARKQKPVDRDDALSRWLSLQAAGMPGTSALDIRNNLVGLIIGAIPTTATTAALAMDELLNRPEALAGAQAAAAANDDVLLASYVFEALRFRPMNPGIFRIAKQDHVLAKGELRSTKIPAGSTVIAATQSAMFDHLVIDAPQEFRVDRSPRDYMLWGHGLHTCFGQHINQVQIPQILKPVLARKGLRRASGDAGKLTMAGPFAGRLVVAFD